VGCADCLAIATRDTCFHREHICGCDESKAWAAQTNAHTSHQHFPVIARRPRTRHHGVRHPLSPQLIISASNLESFLPQPPLTKPHMARITEHAIIRRSWHDKLWDSCAVTSDKSWCTCPQCLPPPDLLKWLQVLASLHLAWQPASGGTLRMDIWIIGHGKQSLSPCPEGERSKAPPPP
jgi:hypothetical protein